MTREQVETKAREILGMGDCRDLMELVDGEQFLEAKWHVFFCHDQNGIAPSDCDCLLGMIRTMESRTFALSLGTAS